VHPAINFQGDSLCVHFAQEHLNAIADLAAYRLMFLTHQADCPNTNWTFDRETESYTVKAPARFATMLGVEAPQRPVSPLSFASCLFDDQLIITKMALDAKRFAVWSDCGLGKTLIELEFARHVVHITGGRVLIFTLNDIVPQFIDEAKKFYGDTLRIRRLESREEMRAWCTGRRRR
jgi:hypothetical protein